MAYLVKHKGRRNQRSLLVLSIAVFVAVFLWVYVSWINPTFGYMGFDYVSPPAPYFILACLLSIAPGLWMPIKLTRPSQLLYWVLYLTVFIPSMFVPLFMRLEQLLDIAFLMISMFAGFLIMGISYYRPLLNIRQFVISSVVFWYVIGAIIFTLTTSVIVIYYGHFKLVALESVYDDLRSSGTALSEGTFVGYAVMWLSGAFFPFLMAWGLHKKQILFFAAGAMGQVMLYATAGMKSVVLSILFIPVLFLFQRGKNVLLGLRLTVGCILLFVALNSVNLAGGNGLKELVLTPSSIVLMRTFSITGMAVGQYQNFFAVKPFTFYSHVKGINLLVEYPFERQIGQEVAFYFYNRDDTNWNANLWCTDGIAALGLPGIFFISIFCGLVFWVLDSVAEGHDPSFVALITSFAAINIGNSSLFTSLYSGGLGFLILLLYFMPRELQRIRTFRQGIDLSQASSNGTLLAQPPKILTGTVLKGTG